jgi:kumamolisin
MAKLNYVPVQGSERVANPAARVIGPAAVDERGEVTVQVRSRTVLPSLDDLGLHAGRGHMTREAFAATHGADPADLAKIEAFARQHGLRVVESSVARQAVVLEGTVGALSAAFDVMLEQCEIDGQHYRCRTGAVHVPQDLADIVVGVFGLDNRPHAKPHFRVRGPAEREVVPSHATARPDFTPVDLAGLYHFPTNVNGQGQCIAIIELGGGFRPEELQTYFTQLHVTPPHVVAVSVDQGQNLPGQFHNDPTDPRNADGEVMLDIEVAGGVAPGAKLAVYFAPNSSRGFLDAITSAIHDSVNNPMVISISWGGAESAQFNTTQHKKAMDHAFQAAAMLGITVCVAAGDDGSTDGVNDGREHVDFPASSPFVLACGGTHLEATAGVISREVVWNEFALGGGATGGGVSDFFRMPSYQAKAHIPANPNMPTFSGRGVPDVAGDAAQSTGYRVLVDGRSLTFGGTSAVAPLWAGLVALLNQALGRSVGFLNPMLYRGMSAGALQDIIGGNNGRFSAVAGWDACTGLGSPHGMKLLQFLQTQ